MDAEVDESEGAGAPGSGWPEGCWLLLVRHLVESDDFVLVLNADFEMVRSNPAFRTVILGGCPDGSSFPSILTPESGDVLRTHGAADSLEQGSVMLQHTLAAGTRTVAYRFQRLDDGWLAVGRDVSEQLEIVRQMAVLVEELEARVHEERALSESLRTLSERDALTGLPNRRSFESQLEGCRTRHETAELEFSVLCLDVDRYKQVNDRYGHAVGDRVLVEVARVLESSIRDGDLAARLGGDEFVVIARHVGDEKALEVAERIRRNVESLALLDVTEGITVSIGVASTRPKDPDRAGTLLKRADEALYHAKRAGRNRTQVAV